MNDGLFPFYLLQISPSPVIISRVEETCAFSEGAGPFQMLL